MIAVDPAISDMAVAAGAAAVEVSLTVLFPRRNSVRRLWTDDSSAVTVLPGMAAASRSIRR